MLSLGKNITRVRSLDSKNLDIEKLRNNDDTTQEEQALPQNVDSIEIITSPLLQEQETAISQNNNTTIREKTFPEITPVSEYKFHTQESAITMNIIKIITANTILVADKLNASVAQSNELRIVVKKAVRNVDEMNAEFKKQTSGW